MFICDKIDVANLIVNSCVAAGTMGATFFALFPKKNKERVVGWFKITHINNNTHIDIKIKNKSKEPIFLGPRDLSKLENTQIGFIVFNSLNRKMDLNMANCINLCLLPNLYIDYYYDIPEILDLEDIEIFLFSNKGTVFKLDKNNEK